MEENDDIQVVFEKNKGRSVYSKRFIKRGTIIFVDSPYVAIVDNQYKKFVCSTCFKYFSESCRQNVITCPEGCSDYYFCSSYCKEYQKIETRHTKMECKWLQYFTTYFKHQLIEDDKNIILLIIKIIARRLSENQSINFLEEPDSFNTNLIPNDICHLIDHLDEYINLKDHNNTCNNNNNNDNNKNNSPDKDIIANEDEINKYRNQWKLDFKKFLNISRIIQNILDSSKHQEILTVGMDSDGDMKMDNNEDSRDDENEETITKADLNILKLLCKIRSNYFGLWHNGLQNNIVLYNEQQQEENQDEEDENTTSESKSRASSPDHNLNKSLSQFQKRNFEFLWCGSAVYLSFSLFNHSCFPNCTTLLEYNNGDNGIFSFKYSSKPLNFSIITLFDIEPNQELLITYIPLNQSRGERIHQLKSSWLFDCNCKRCEIELTNPKEINEIFNQMCCKNNHCNSGILFPLENGMGICRVCKEKQSDCPLKINFENIKQLSNCSK